VKLVGEVGNWKIVAHIAFKFYSVASGTFSTGSTTKLRGAAALCRVPPEHLVRQALIALQYIDRLAVVDNSAPGSNSRPDTKSSSEYSGYTDHLEQGVSLDHNRARNYHRELMCNVERLCNCRPGIAYMLHQRGIDHLGTASQRKLELPKTYKRLSNRTDSSL